MSKSVSMESAIADADQMRQEMFRIARRRARRADVGRHPERRRSHPRGLQRRRRGGDRAPPGPTTSSAPIHRLTGRRRRRSSRRSGATHGFDQVKVVVDRPGDFSMTGLAEGRWELRLRDGQEHRPGDPHRLSRLGRQAHSRGLTDVPAPDLGGLRGRRLDPRHRCRGWWRASSTEPVRLPDGFLGEMAAADPSGAQALPPARAGAPLRESAFGARLPARGGAGAARPRRARRRTTDCGPGWTPWPLTRRWPSTCSRTASSRGGCSRPSLPGRLRTAALAAPRAGLLGGGDRTGSAWSSSPSGSVARAPERAGAPADRTLRRAGRAALQRRGRSRRARLRRASTPPGPRCRTRSAGCGATSSRSARWPTGAPRFNRLRIQGEAAADRPAAVAASCRLLGLHAAVRSSATPRHGDVGEDYLRVAGSSPR